MYEKPYDKQVGVLVFDERTNVQAILSARRNEGLHLKIREGYCEFWTLKK